MAGFWLEPIKFTFALLFPAAAVMIFQHPPNLEYFIKSTQYVVYPAEEGREKLAALNFLIMERAEKRRAEQNK
eukprot:CAMPEP_0173393214 /NCGR_PEP_ID=MMETSP1356-20130122/21981_1 /TAXON_ID=77927 ORGANISM="Hemiselmis virescens, Strain PCC157" /NCGR_SAMPLE_ID=MMETSP1356 /ASSEMBLY_ACC=CAM_ASM_000847 /LENGTH=72 /DNA_ID=CAMNT_0014351199 /DNA_START=287 /DNA_END=505 /DNA_ORIENTATION=+